MPVEFNCQKNVRTRNVFPLVPFFPVAVWSMSNNHSDPKTTVLEDFKTFYLFVGFNVQRRNYLFFTVKNHF